MRFLLDTNVVSEIRKIADGRADANVVAWCDTVDASTLFICSITILELELGILQLERRDQAQGRRLRAWLTDQVLPEFADRTLDIDTVIARRCAALHVPDPRSERDALIAASAIVHGMTVATRNAAAFAPTGAALVNPWADSVER